MDWDKFINVSRDAQTWFVDNGRAQGRTINHDLKFSSITANGHSCNKNGAAGGPKGIEATVNAESWNMAIGFGGIFGAQNGHGHDTSAATVGDTGVNFWGVGGWQGEALNPFTDDLQQFVGNLNPGEKFKFKEDPLKTVYTFSPIISAAGYLNHSTKIGVEDYGEPTTDFTPFEEQRKHKDGASMGKNMEPTIPHNFRRTWEAQSITPAIQDFWNPFEEDEISNGITLELTICDSDGFTTSTAGTITTGDQSGPDGNDVSIFVTDIYGTNTNPLLEVTDVVLHEGMALKSYVRHDNGAVRTIQNVSGHTASTTSPHSGNDFLAIRKIIPHYSDGTIIATPSNVVTHYELILGGYNFPMQNDDHSWLQGPTNQDYPKLGENYTFVQVGANGHNANTEFNINHCGYKLSILQPLNNQKMGKITAVGPRLQLISEIQPLEVLSENPAIWETEPKESKDLDIYYEASAAVPITVNADNIHDAIPIGSRVRAGNGTAKTVNGHTGMNVNLNGNVAVNVNNGTLFTVIRPDGLEYEILFAVKNVTNPNIVSQLTSSPLFPSNLYNARFKLAWHNCYSFGNGVESNRIRDNYNLPFISNGVKVSTTLENEYKEEHRKYGLIYSGIYNSVAGVNNLNQFIQAEKITKDINPIYGSIQKLHSRDSDLVTLCEDKVLKILANKDAVFNADGNTNLTATENVLGQTIPFKGEYGISTNPESFASEAYRAYFADRVRGTVMRLSMDGLTPISGAGMHDWFRDNLKLVYDGKIIGSYDDRNEEYNIKLETYPGGNPFGSGSSGVDVWGCTNPLASNYNPLATVDDGTCILCSPNNFSAADIGLLESCCGKCDSTVLADPTHSCYDFCNSDLSNCCDNHCENVSVGLWDVNSTYNIGDVVEQVFQNGSFYYVAIASVPAGQTGPGYGVNPYWDDCCTFYGQSPQYGPCNPVEPQPDDPCDDYPGDLNYNYQDQSGTCCGKCDQFIAGDPNHPCYDFCVEWGDCCEDDVVLGCTDPDSINYNPLATLDDNSCLYGEGLLPMGIHNMGVKSPNKLPINGDYWDANTNAEICVYPPSPGSPVYGSHMTKGLATTGFIHQGGTVYTESHYWNLGGLTPGNTYTLKWKEIVLALRTITQCSDCLMGGWAVRVSEYNPVSPYLYPPPTAFNDINVVNATPIYDPITNGTLSYASSLYHDSNCNQNTSQTITNTAGAPSGSESEWNDRSTTFTTYAPNLRIHFIAYTDFNACTDCHHYPLAPAHGSYMGLSELELI